MGLSDKVKGSFFYVADKRPVLAFNTPEEALEFQKGIRGAEIYGIKTHVFLPTPYGLEFVRGGEKGETAYSEHLSPLTHFFKLTNFDQSFISRNRRTIGLSYLRATEQCTQMVNLQNELFS